MNKPDNSTTWPYRIGWLKILDDGTTDTRELHAIEGTWSSAEAIARIESSSCPVGGPECITLTDESAPLGRSWRWVYQAGQLVACLDRADAYSKAREVVEEVKY